MAKIRGFALRGLLRYVKHTRPDGGIRQVVSELTGDAAVVFAKPIERGAWYPYEIYRDLLRVVGEQLAGERPAGEKAAREKAAGEKPGRGERPLMYEIGRFTSQHEGETLFELFSGRTTVEGLLKNSAPLWNRYCDSGEFVAPDFGSGNLDAELRGFPGISPDHCHLLTGWIEGMGRAAGAKDLEVEKSRCVHRGDDCCGYSCRWT